MKPLTQGLLIGGPVLLIGGPLAGTLFTTIGMIGAFHTLGEQGISEPKVLANDMAQALVAMGIGLVLAIPGLILTVLGAMAHFSEKRGERVRP